LGRLWCATRRVLEYEERKLVVLEDEEWKLVVEFNDYGGALRV
jgi:hypothetical protein